MSQIFETAAKGMRLIDKDFNVLRMNERLETLSGVSRGEAIGKKCYKLFAGPQCHTSGCPLTRIINGDKYVEVDVVKERCDGTKIPCIITATPLCSPDGQLIGIVEDVKDITHRKQAEAVLKRYQLLFDNASDIILFVKQDGQITEANSTAIKTYGYTREELLTIKIQRFCMNKGKL